MREKLKSLIASDQTFYSLLVILVGFGGFLLGGGELLENKAEIVSKATVAAEETVPPPVNNPKAVEVAPTVLGVVVGSKSGTKFHLPTCPGAAQIKPENLIQFASVAQALAAGYKPATNCPGLVQ